MSKSADFSQIPTTIHSSPRPPGDSLWPSPVSSADPRVPLLNLSTVRSRMDSLHRFLSDSVNKNSLIGKDQMDMVSTEISSAIHQIIVNGAALLACTQLPPPPPPPHFPQNNAHLKFSDQQNLISDKTATTKSTDLKFSDQVDEDPNFSDHLDVVETMKVEEGEEEEEEIPISIPIPSDDWEIIELDSVELLAEHIHFCDICGKGFKRDANLRMHMRAHGNQFKTPEALAKPERVSLGESNRRLTRFSCPFVGCNRNKSHKKFRPLKSAICVKNHFKRSHCPKMYSCNRCNKKSFSVLADLKSHLKHCGESKWKCSCGTTFSRKDKLFGHMALFEGHMPAVAVEATTETAAASVVLVEEDEEDEDRIMEGETGDNSGDNGFFDGLLDGFGSIDEYCLQDVLGSPNPNGFYNF